MMVLLLFGLDSIGCCRFLSLAAVMFVKGNGGYICASVAIRERDASVRRGAGRRCKNAFECILCLSKKISES